VSEFERGVKLRFGKLIEADIQPGLHVKLPIVDDVRIFDARILTLGCTAGKLLYHREKAS
jgi:membrane protease subunit HflC